MYFTEVPELLSCDLLKKTKINKNRKLRGDILLKIHKFKKEKNILQCYYANKLENSMQKALGLKKHNF